MWFLRRLSGTIRGLEISGPQLPFELRSFHLPCSGQSIGWLWQKWYGFFFYSCLLFTCSYSGIATAYFFWSSSKPKVIGRHIVRRAYNFFFQKKMGLMHAINGYKNWLLLFVKGCALRKCMISRAPSSMIEECRNLLSVTWDRRTHIAVILYHKKPCQ